MTTTTVPAGLRLGRRDRGVPDRRRRRRGWARRERLGPLLRDARQGAERRHRARSPATSTAAIPRTSRSCASSGSTRSASRSRGRASFPKGAARVNEAGLDFYDRLVDELLANGITPFPTLFHWDTPQALEDAGGWTSRADGRGVRRVRRGCRGRLGDRITHWTTHNEPWVVAWIGHAWGEHAPGRTSEADAIAAAHHCCCRTAGRSRRSARSRRTPRSGSCSTSRTSIRRPIRPRTSRPRGRSTARRTAGSSIRSSAASIRPTCSSATRHAACSDGDLEAISAPIDFLGVNNYFRFVVRRARTAAARTSCSDPDAQRTDMGWEVYPDGLYQLLVRVARDYAPPAIYVTENGAAFGDIRGHDGRVHDPERIAYLESHIDAVARARRGGRAGEGLLRLEPARQLRVGLRLLEAVRDRLRRLPDARARPEGQLLLVPRADREQPCESTHEGRPAALHAFATSARATSRACCARSPRSATTASSSSTCTATTPAGRARWLDELGLVAAGRHAGLDALEHGAARARGGAANTRLRPHRAQLDRPAGVERRRRAATRRADRRDRAASAASRAEASGSTTTGASSRRSTTATRCSTCCARCRPSCSGSSSTSAGCGRPAPTRSSELERTTGRCPLVHVKDFRARGTREYCPVGDGAVGYDRVLPAAVARGRRVAHRRAGQARGAGVRRRSSARSTPCGGSRDGMSGMTRARRRRRLRDHREGVRRGLGGVRLVRRRRLRRPRRGARRGVRRRCTACAWRRVDELIADPSIDVVLNLTPPGAHAAVIARRARGRQARLHREAAHDDRRRGRGAARRGRAPRPAHRLRARHLPRQRVRDGARADRAGRHRDAARRDRAMFSSAAPTTGTRTPTSSTAPAAGRCSTSRRTTSPRSRRCSARSRRARASRRRRRPSGASASARAPARASRSTSRRTRSRRSSSRAARSRRSP